MTDIANLADLYEAVFQEPPSAMTRGSLVAMAHAFRITDNDPLGPVIVMSMRSTDLVATALKQRTADETKHRERLRELNAELSELTLEIVQARHRRWWHRAHSAPREPEIASVLIDHRRASPLLAYLGCAILGKNGVVDHDDRVTAARFDLAMLIGIAAVIGIFGAWVYRIATQI